MNYFDEENRIIEHFQGVDCKSVFFLFQSDIAIHIFESIHDIDNWRKWVNSSGKSDPPPDFYCKDFRYMMDVMRVDDHSFKNKKGKLVNPVNMRESKIQAELIKKGIPELFPNVNGIIVNAVTDLPTQKDHNYKFYKKNFVVNVSSLLFDCFDVLDSKWDKLARELPAEQYREVFCGHLNHDMNADELRTRICLIE